MKRYAESVSDDMGFCGAINNTVLVEAQRRLDEKAARRKQNTMNYFLHWREARRIKKGK